MKKYRLVEYAPLDGKRGNKKVRTTIWVGTDKVEMKRQIKDWCAKPHKPYADISYYYGSKLIYAYEL
jgi:hypothetical protein